MFSSFGHQILSSYDVQYSCVKTINIPLSAYLAQSRLHTHIRGSRRLAGLNIRSLLRAFDYDKNDIRFTSLSLGI